MGQGFDYYRNKEILTTSKDAITQISVNTLGNNTLTFQKGENNWTQGGNPIDSSAFAEYLNGLQIFLESLLLMI